MRTIDAKQLAASATDFGIRADFVRRDPAVQKSAKQAWADLKTAAESSRVLISEVSDSWARSKGLPPDVAHNPVVVL